MVTKVGVFGYGQIGTRLAYGAALQKDMELVGVADIAPTLAIKALKARGMKLADTDVKLYCVDPSRTKSIEDAGIPVAGTAEDLLQEVDIILDAAPGGIGAKNKILYEKFNVPAVFQGGEAGEVADVFFHGYANYEKGLGQSYLKLTSCNTTGLIRTVDCLDRTHGLENIAITIVRRCADPGDTHRGYVDLLKPEPVPNHQAVDLMEIMPHVQATGFLVHVPVTHGHIINVVATPKKPLTKEEMLESFNAHPRIQVLRIADGFNTNTSLLQFNRFAGKPFADMYETVVWEETVATIGNLAMYAIYIPQEAVTIPESIDGIRASLQLQTDRLEAVGLTNKYLGMEPKRRLW
jgi:glyceraldehyde-3-phosphate dehydrogenase (NAD(P))